MFLWQNIRFAFYFSIMLQCNESWGESEDITQWHSSSVISVAAIFWLLCLTIEYSFVVYNVSALPLNESKIEVELQHLSPGQDYEVWIRAMTAVGPGNKTTMRFKTNHHENFGSTIYFCSGVILLFYNWIGDKYWSLATFSLSFRLLESFGICLFLLYLFDCCNMVSNTLLLGFCYIFS